MIINKTLLLGGVAVLGAVLAGQLTLGAWPNLRLATASHTSHVRRLPSDEVLTQVLEGNLERMGVDTQQVNVNVKNRVAILRGFAYDKREKQAVIATAEAMNGIQDVNTDQLNAVVQLPAVVVVATPDDYNDLQRNLVAKR